MFMNILYLLDWSNWKYKFKNALGLQSTISGVSYDVSSIIGFKKALKALPYDHIGICLDAYPQKNIDLAGDYKSTRNKTLEENLSVKNQELLEYVVSFGESLGKHIYVFGCPGLEADQVASSITHIIADRLPARAVIMDTLQSKDPSNDPWLKRIDSPYEVVPVDFFKQFQMVILATTDSDWTQLCRYPNVAIDTSTSGIGLTTDTPKAVQYLPPWAVVPYKVLVGDTSDHIVGLKYKAQKKQIIECLRDFKESDWDDFLNYKSRIPILNATLQEVVKNQRNEFQCNLYLAWLKYFGQPIKFNIQGDYHAIESKYHIR